MNSWAAAVFGCTLAFIIVAVLATAGRFHARKLMKAGLGVDDWIILIDTILAIGLAVLMTWACLHAGVGLSPLEETPDIIVRYLKVTWANELIVTPIIGTVKIAVLIFYKRIFITPLFQNTANVLIVLSACWTIAFTCTLAFNLLPFDLEWNPQPDRPHNLNFGAMLLAMGASDLFLDVCILSLPVFVIKQLNLSKKRKVVVIGLLWTGAFCIVASAVRLVYISHFLSIEGTDDAFAGVTAQISLWSTIEPCASLIAASLPTLGPLFTKGQGFHTLLMRTRYVFSSNRSKNRLVSKTAKSFPSSGSDVERGSSSWRKITEDERSVGNVTTVELGDLSGSVSGSAIRVDKSFSSEVV